MKTSYPRVVLLILLHISSNVILTNPLKIRESHSFYVTGWVPNTTASNPFYLAILSFYCKPDQYQIKQTLSPKNEPLAKLTDVTCTEAVQLSTIQFKTKETLMEAMDKLTFAFTSNVYDMTSELNLRRFFRKLSDSNHSIETVSNPLNFEPALYTESSQVKSGRFENFIASVPFGEFKVQLNLTFSNETLNFEENQNFDTFKIERDGYNSNHLSIHTIMNNFGIWELEMVRRYVENYPGPGKWVRSEQDKKDDEEEGKGEDKPEEEKPEGGGGREEKPEGGGGREEKPEEERKGGRKIKFILIGIGGVGILLGIVGFVIVKRRRRYNKRRNDKFMKKMKKSK